jgi:arsenate reductase-like glutaredoxin family protein
MQVEAFADASKEKKDRAEALKLAKSVHKVIVARGKKTVTVDVAKDAPDDDTLAGLLLGPSGNLRAPTLRIGNTLYVGFSEDVYRRFAKSG